MENKTYSEEDILDFLRHLFCFVPVIDLQVKIDQWKQYRQKPVQKKPLFVTVYDGVEIFENQKFWSVNKNDFRLNEFLAFKNHNHPYPELEYFGSTEAAEEYIFIKKPCINYEDFISHSNESISTKDTLYIDIKTLKELIKAKI